MLPHFGAGDGGGKIVCRKYIAYPSIHIALQYLQRESDIFYYYITNVGYFKGKSLFVLDICRNFALANKR